MVCQYETQIHSKATGNIYHSGVVKDLEGCGNSYRDTAQVRILFLLATQDVARTTS